MAIVYVSLGCCLPSDSFTARGSDSIKKRSLSVECLISLQHLAKNDGFLEELFNVIEFELHNACLTASSSQYLLTPVIMHLSPEDAISMITQFSPSAGQDDVNQCTERQGKKKLNRKVKRVKYERRKSHVTRPVTFPHLR